MKNPKQKSVYNQFQRFADITVNAAQKGNFQRVSCCLELAGLLFRYGNFPVRNAVINVYVYSLSLILDSGNHIARSVYELMPTDLKKVYESQLNIGGI